MNRILEILRTQYIGAIVIGYLAAQGFITAVGLATVPLRWYLSGRNSVTQSVLFHEQPQKIQFPWDSVLTGITTILLYFALCYALFRWLYLPTIDPSDPDEETPTTDLGDPIA